MKELNTFTEMFASKALNKLSDSRTAINEADFVSGDIKKQHFQKFVKQVLKKKRRGMLVYLMTLIAFCVAGICTAITEGEGFEETAGGIISFLGCFFLFQLILNSPGQACLRLLIGASKIKRQDMIETIKNPVMEIIEEAKSNGLTLPDDIEVYEMNSPEPVAYAFGMNSIAVSYAMTELPEDEFKAKILAELYRIHIMDPDYLLFMVGSNMISLFLGAFVMLFGLFYMKFGDRRSNYLGESESKLGALAFFGSAACLAAWLGVCFLFIRGSVRANNFEADSYVADAGYGISLCRYLDDNQAAEKTICDKFLEMGHPSVNDRIAKMQSLGVMYRR